MGIRERLSRLIDTLLDQIPGPPPEPPPPDADGRREGDLDYERAVLEAQLQAKGSAATSGTVVGSDPFPPPPPER